MCFTCSLSSSTSVYDVRIVFKAQANDPAKPIILYTDGVSEPFSSLSLKYPQLAKNCGCRKRCETTVVGMCFGVWRVHIAQNTKLRVWPPSLPVIFVRSA